MKFIITKLFTDKFLSDIHIIIPIYNKERNFKINEIFKKSDCSIYDFRYRYEMNDETIFKLL